VAHFRNFQVCHECATKILFDFINIEKRYKRKNPANRWICRVYRFFWPFLKTLKILFFLCFRTFAEKEGFEPPDLLQSTVFKTAAFDRSAISPVCCDHLLIASANIRRFFGSQNFFRAFLLIILN
jgi:hypothetical protein